LHPTLAETPLSTCIGLASARWLWAPSDPAIEECSVSPAGGSAAVVATAGVVVIGVAAEIVECSFVVLATEEGFAGGSTAGAAVLVTVSRCLLR